MDQDLNNRKSTIITVKHVFDICNNLCKKFNAFVAKQPHYTCIQLTVKRLKIANNMEQGHDEELNRNSLKEGDAGRRSLNKPPQILNIFRFGSTR